MRILSQAITSLLVSIVGVFTFDCNAVEINSELNHDGKMTYAAPAMSTNYVSKSSRDCPSRIRRATSSSATAKITLHVVDEEGNDIENANVVFAFRKFDRSFSFDYKPPRTKKRKTDKNGRASASGESCWDVGFRVSKDGYYSSNGKYLLWGNPTKESVDWRGRWHPWNPELQVSIHKCCEQVCLKKGINARNVPLETTLGFDAEKADFVKPFGAGVVTSLLFRVSSCHDQILGTTSNVFTIGTLGNGLARVKKDRGVLPMRLLSMPKAMETNELQFISYYDKRGSFISQNLLEYSEDYIAVDVIDATGNHHSALITGFVWRIWDKQNNDPSQKSVCHMELLYLYDPQNNSHSLEVSPLAKKPTIRQMKKHLSGQRMLKRNRMNVARKSRNFLRKSKKSKRAVPL